MPPKAGQSIGKLSPEQRIIMAMRTGIIGSLDELIPQITNVAYQDFPGNSLLHYAVQYGQPLALRKLIDRGVPVDLQDKDGNTPLHLIVGMTATEDKHQSIILQIVQTLLAFGADPMIQNNEGLTPVEYILSFNDSSNTPEFNEQIKRIFEFYMTQKLDDERAAANKNSKTLSLYPLSIKHKKEGGGKRRTHQKKLKSIRRKSRRSLTLSR